MYTKGEWVADNGDSELWGIFSKDDSNGIAYLCEPNGTLLRLGEAEANAHLIAAAPDTTEALRDAIDCWRELGKIIFAKGLTNLFEEMPDKFKGDNNPFIRADKAIAKAEGK